MDIEWTEPLFLRDAVTGDEAKAFAKMPRSPTSYTGSPWIDVQPQSGSLEI
jgi:hypothetical protein